MAPAVNPTWQAARAGMPGDSTATNHAAQIDQFLAVHGITPIYPGTQIVAPAGAPGLDWVSLGAHQLDQPFAMPAGKTTIGRVTVPISPVGQGADVTVGLFTDSGGSPGSLIVSTRLPASWLSQLAAANGLGSGGPLATAASNTMLYGAGTVVQWAQPAVSANGAGQISAVCTSGNYTIFAGGYDSTAGAAVATVATVEYLGGSTVSGPSPQPPLPKAAWAGSLAATADTLIFAGGMNVTGLTNVWTASWDPTTGTVGAWTAQTALPAATVQGGMAAWGSFVYLVGGNTNYTEATATANVYYASAVNGQIQSWIAAPPLPFPITSAFVAVIGNWLVCAGGQNTSNVTQTTTYYAAIRPDGSLGGWMTGPTLPNQQWEPYPGWDLAVVGSALSLMSGGTTSNAQTLTFTADGPAPAWSEQTGFGGVYVSGAYPGSAPGEWQVFTLGTTAYTVFPLVPVPLISVPLPATGLTAGGTYHIVVSQAGGDLNDYVQAALNPTALPTGANQKPAGGGSWTPVGSSYALPLSVWDQTPGGKLLHTWEDSGARITSLVTAGASSQLLGLCEATTFPDDSASGSATSPTAFQQLAGVFLPEGTYLIDWTVTLSGTLSAGDANNFQVSVGPTYIVTSTNTATAGTYQQARVQVTVPSGGATVRVQAGNAGTTGSVYSATIGSPALSPLSAVSAIAYNGVVPAGVTQLA